MLISCWSAKGGSGTTVVAGALAVLLAGSHGGALLADLAGDLPAALGLAEPAGPGLAGWLAAGADVPHDALARLEVPVTGSLGLLPRGRGPLSHPDRSGALVAALAADPRPVVVDCGLIGAEHDAGGEPGWAAAASATHSLLVIRACYLALRRAAAAPLRPSGVILVEEAGRSLTAADIEAVLGVPVRAVLGLDPAVARTVDAGLLATRLPRVLRVGLRDAA